LLYCCIVKLFIASRKIRVSPKDIDSKICLSDFPTYADFRTNDYNSVLP